MGGNGEDLKSTNVVGRLRSLLAHLVTGSLILIMFTVIRYENVPIEQGTLGQVFDVIESNRVALGIVDYTISQPSLEQVFLQFARRQDLESSFDGENDDSDVIDNSDGNEEMLVERSQLG